eukprot:973643-Pyramimonas_sp.AAC.1
METGVLLAFFGAKKHTFGTRQPHAAMLASVLMTCLGRVKAQPPSQEWQVPISYWVYYMTFIAML